MAVTVTPDLKGIKLQLNLEKGTQTISNCNVAATNESLYALATAVEPLLASPVEEIVRIKEEVLIAEEA